MPKVSRRTRSWATAILLAALTAAFFLLPTTAAEAHRDGCHRWHSCPSDSGSYVCGDLGDYSECPGGKPDDDSSSKPERTYEPPDLDPPKAPRLGRSSVQSGGRVTIKVRAEKRSAISVETDAGKRVARATATGKDQKISFRAKTGRQTYAVKATDKAGNTSEDTATTVSVDATPPVLKDVTSVAGTDATGASSLAFTSEPGATWTLTGAGPKQHGTVTDPKTVLNLWLPNGHFKPVINVRDKAGNSRQFKSRIDVRVDRPLLRSALTSSPKEGRLAYALTGTPRSTGKLIFKHLDDMPFSLDEQGAATVAVDIADGTYGPGQIELTDFAGRTVTTNVPEAVVDTTPPALDLTSDPEQASKGTLALRLQAEPRSEVRVSAALVDRNHHAAPLDESKGAPSGPWTITRLPAAGAYSVTATATDAVGNVSTRQVDVDVVIPATSAEIALGLTILQWLAALPLALAVLALHYRRRIAGWVSRRAEAARARAAEARWQRQLTEFRRASDAWETDRRHLEARLTMLTTFQPGADTGGLIKLKRNEYVYGTHAAVLVEKRIHRGVETTVVGAEGPAVITSQRVVLPAAKNREWAFAKLDGLVDEGSDLYLPVSNRKHTSGLRLGPRDRAAFRTRLDIALADQAGRRDALVSAARTALREHEHLKPSPPPIAPAGVSRQ
ncbi:hypothetical protein SAMN04488544_1784 [Microlunatus sagamiharensis]|uniref:Ig-like domain (Group 3) n=1 Tax=Microlunatus sagamiharensis TaxID=546874 RepID=A0A1H2MBZ8_9ACTN|nr:hypothetical protein [Microlunatus sagamiharensis]SDU90743.1 hypothetical protein SAMN04488544_1784 [Microlunatus sagamiharensis]